MAVAWQTQTDLFEAAKHAPPAHVGANMAGERRRRPFEAGPRHARRRPRLDGDLVQPGERALERGIVHCSARFAFHQSTAHAGAKFLRPARGWGGKTVFSPSPPPQGGGGPEGGGGRAAQMISERS